MPLAGVSCPVKLITETKRSVGTTTAGDSVFHINLNIQTLHITQNSVCDLHKMASKHALNDRPEAILIG